jgi:hypothetical protein
MALLPLGRYLLPYIQVNIYLTISFVLITFYYKFQKWQIG